MTTAEVMILLVLPLEAVTLRLAQRRLFWDIARVVRWRWVAYAIAVPSTIAHELAHVAMALVLGVPIGRRAGGSIELFRPRYNAQNRTVRLGSASIRATGVVRRSLIAVAPFVLVPWLIVGVNLLLLGTTNPLSLVAGAGLPHHVAVWRMIVWIVLAATLPMAAFPSIGDHIGTSEVVALVILGAVGASAVLLVGGVAGLVLVLDGVVGILLLPTISAGILLLIFSRHARRGRRRATIRRARPRG